MYEFWEVGRGRWYEQAGVVSWSAWEDFGGFSAGEQHVHKAGDPGPLEPAPSAVLKSFLGGASGEWVCTLLLPSAPLSVLISFCSHLSLSYGSWGLWGIFESNQPHNVCFSLLYLKILCYFVVYIPLYLFLHIIQRTLCSKMVQWIFPVVLQIPGILYTYPYLRSIEIRDRLT